MNKVQITIKIIYTFIIVAILIGAVIFAFIMKGKFQLINVGFADIGMYGAIILSFLIVQQVLSILNNCSWIPFLCEKSDKTPKVGLQVVGYRQDSKLFRACLTSLSKQTYPNLSQIIVGIDGNQQKDLIMQKVFLQVFPTGMVLRLNKTYFQMTEQERKLIQQTASSHKQICISQPHQGKRDIMYTAFHCHSSEIQLVALTDSDTFWSQNALLNLVDVMVGHDNYRRQQNQKSQNSCCKQKVKECGAVTGDVGIWNKQNYLSFLSALRYWFAFNVQRAADSYFGVVNCVSGPLGLYKKELLQDISHIWINQTFMGQKCTYGDDRSLSNHVLSRGMSIFYTPYSKVQTDTPAELLRWIPQQTRWCKSFYREFFYNIKSFYQHSVWMSIQLVFQFVYPFFILVTLVCFPTYSVDLMMIVFIFIVFMGTIRGLFGFMRTFQFRFLHYAFYVFFYILFLLPSKLWAILTIWNNDWGTSSRLVRYQNCLKALHALIWAVGLVIYIGIFFVKYLFVDKIKLTQSTGIAALVCLIFIIILVFHWNIWGILFLVPQVEDNLNAHYDVDKEINQKRRYQLRIKMQQNNIQSQRKLASQNKNQKQKQLIYSPYTIVVDIIGKNNSNQK